MATIQFSYSESVPVEYALEHYSQMAFPHLKTRITNKRISNPLIAVLAKKGKEIIGLSLASREHAHVSEIISLQVKEDYRLKGVGKKLIEQSIAIQQQLGFKSVRILFYEHWSNLAFIQSLIRSGFWSQPLPVLHRFEHHYHKNKHKILPTEMRLKDTYQIISFKESGKEVQNLLLSGSLINDKKDEKFSFKAYENRFDPMISHVMLKNQKPIGWCIAVIAKASSIDHNLYILPTYRKDPNLPMALISKNWISQMKSPYQKAIWIIDASNNSMVRFMERKLPHLIDFKSTLFLISKELVLN